MPRLNGSLLGVSAASVLPKHTPRIAVWGSPLVRTAKCSRSSYSSMPIGSLGLKPYALVDRKSTRLNSSHLGSSYAVFCLKKKNFVGYPRFPAPVEFIAAVIAYYVHPVNIQTACLIMEGAEFTENIINGVERPVKAAELFAFTLRVRAGNTDVLTDAEENVRQKLRAEGVM